MIRRTGSLAALMAVIALAPLGAQTDRTPDLATTVPGSWTTDRYAPCQFALANGVQGRNDVLQTSVCAADNQANRPSAYSSSFYNTQGKQIAIDGVGTTPPSSQILSLDLYVNGSWADSLNGRVATGMWSRVNQINSDNEADAWYPILGFHNGGPGGIGAFRFFDSNIGYVQLAAAVNYDAWNTLAITFTGNIYEAFVNGVSQYAMAGDPGADRLTAAFVNTSNFGPNNNTNGEYTANWSNTPAVTATPEPASMALLATGLIGIGGIASRRRRKSA